MEEFSISKNNMVILKCNEKHVYHYNCIKQWFKISKQCPLCK